MAQATNSPITTEQIRQGFEGRFDKPIAAAAARVAGLINSKSSSPTAQEIAAAITAALADAPEIGKPANTGGLVLTIGGIAQEIADLYDLRDAMEVGESQQNKRLAAEPDDPTPVVPFEEHKDAADIRRDTLEMVLLQLEPDSVDDTLSLLLMTAHLFDGWASDAYAHQNMPRRAEREWQVMTHAFEALVRWLVHRSGAKSPLMEAGYFRDGWLAPPPEQIATALAKARELAAQTDHREGQSQ